MYLLPHLQARPPGIYKSEYLDELEIGEDLKPLPDLSGVMRRKGVRKNRGGYVRKITRCVCVCDHECICLCVCL